MVPMLQQKELLNATENSPDNAMRKKDEGEKLQGEIILQMPELANNLKFEDEPEKEDADKEKGKKKKGDEDDYQRQLEKELGR